MAIIAITSLSLALILCAIQIGRIYKHINDLLDIEEKTNTLLVELGKEYAQMREELTALKLEKELDQLKSKLK